MANINKLKEKIKSTIYPNGKGAINAAAHQSMLLDIADTLGEFENTKINREADDYYPQLSVGVADNLAGVDDIESEVNFRRSGGGAISDGVARIESIKGNSLVWNQLLDPTTQGNGRLAVYEENGKWVAEVTELGADSPAANLTIPVIRERNSVQGHKYLALLDVTNSYSLEPAVKIGGKYETGKVHIIQSTDSSLMYLYPFGAGTTTISIGSKAVLNIAAFHDLTKMYGSGNEPTTMQEFFTRIPIGVDMNVYNEGEVIHMNALSLESQGVNAWNEKWELGEINASTGAEVAGANTIRTGFIRIIPNEKYFITIQGSSSSLFLRARLYDFNKNFIGITSASGADIYTNEIFTMPPNAHYIRFAPFTSVLSQSDLLCINISDSSINGKYFPYIKRVEDMSIIRKYFPEGMKSAGTAHDEIRYNKVSGRWERICRIGESDMGDFSWSYQPKNSNCPHGFFYTSINSDLRDMKNGAEVMSAIYARGGFADDKTIAANASNNMLYARDSAYTDAASFKAAMRGIMLYYELAEPIVTELDEADQFKDLDYQVWNAGTEKAIAEGKSAPLAAAISYGFNAIGKIKELESLVAALRAKVGI